MAGANQKSTGRTFHLLQPFRRAFGKAIGHCGINGFQAKKDIVEIDK